jgi:hypothetical protein
MKDSARKAMFAGKNKSGLTKKQVGLLTTEYKPTSKEDEVDLLQGRVHFALMDMMKHMKSVGMRDKEIKKLVLRDVKSIITME